VCLCVQTTVQELLKAFENSTQNNNPIDDTTADAAETTAAAAAAAAVDGGSVDDDAVMSAVNQTQNNDASHRGQAGGPAPAVSRDTSYQNQSARRAAANTAYVRRVTSQTAAQRARSSSSLPVGGHRSVRNASSAASLPRVPARRSLDSSQYLYHRSLSPSASRQHQQQQQRGRDRLSRQTSRQAVVPRRRSDIGLPLTV